MRAIFVDENNETDIGLCQTHGITSPFLSVRDSRTTLTVLEQLRDKHGMSPGLFACSQGTGWPHPTTHSGPGFADWLYSKVNTIAPGTKGGFPKVMLNCETHDTQWIMSMLKRWRKHSPYRETYYCPEGRQAGIFSKTDVAQINQMGIYVVPQAYRGEEKVPYEPHYPGVIDEMLKAGFNPNRLFLCWDGAWKQHLPYNWQGFIFTQGRLQG